MIDLAGDIDARRRGGARRRLRARPSPSPPTPCCSTSPASSYINSTGIALIVGLLGRARADGVAVRACGLSDHYREIFEITRLSDFMTIYADEAQRRSRHGGEQR